MILSKKYSHWREIKNDYSYYMTALGPYSLEELIHVLLIDLGDDEAKWPFSSAQIMEFAQSDDTVLNTWD